MDKCDICERDISDITFNRIGGYTYGLCDKCLMNVTNYIKNMATNSDDFVRRITIRTFGKYGE